MPPVSLSALLATLPRESSFAPRPAASKIVVLDDDPTGTQTVHSIPVLTRWDTTELMAALREPGPCFYLLTNTRAFPPAQACAINREIGLNLAAAAARTHCDFTVVSRSDSTLRGHYPAETDALATGLGRAFDGTLLIPAFFAGGRLTIGDTHYVVEGGVATPAGETEFARDASFGYRSSNLPAWIEEKTAGSVRAIDVRSISIDDLRLRPPAVVAEKLAALPRGGVAIVNAATASDLAALTHALAFVACTGRRYLFRTAADFVAAYAGIAPRALLTAAELRSPATATGGLLVAGSYVGKTSAQLDALFTACPRLIRVEVAVAALIRPERREAEIARCRTALEQHLAVGLSAVLMTTRQLVTGHDTAANLGIGEAVSSGLVGIIGALAIRPRWLVAKGGITSSDLATRALGVRRAWVLGQALPGVPVWRTGAESKWPGLAYVVFPGNVGGPASLAGLIGALLD